MLLNEFDLSKLQPGKHDLRFSASQLLDGTQLILRVGVIKGENDGPVISIIAAQHGNEWNGTYVCHQLFNRLDHKNIYGTLILIPTANPIAFHQAQRISMIDNIDMNRVWGIKHRRKPTEHLAETIFQALILKSHFVVDVHTGGPGEYALCVAVLQNKWADLAASLNLTCTMVHEADGVISSAKGSTSLAHACNRLDIPCLLIELGHGRNVDLALCKRFIKSLQNFFVKAGMLKGSLIAHKTKIYTSKVTVASDVSGFLEITCGLEDEVKKGEIVAKVTTLFSEKVSEIKTPMSGIVIYKRRLSLASPGDTLVHVAF